MTLKIEWPSRHLFFKRPKNFSISKFDLSFNISFVWAASLLLFHWPINVFQCISGVIKITWFPLCRKILTRRIREDLVPSKVFYYFNFKQPSTEEEESLVFWFDSHSKPINQEARKAHLYESTCLTVCRLCFIVSGFPKISFRTILDSAAHLS